MLYYSTAFLLLIVGSVLTFDRPVPFRPVKYWNVPNDQQIRDLRHNEYSDRQFLFNILYGNFNLNHQPPPPPPTPTKRTTTEMPTTPSTTTEPMPSSTTTPEPPSSTTTMATTTTPAPECLSYVCNCCVFNSVDPNYPGQTGLRSNNYPADYGDNNNCVFQLTLGYPKVNITFTTFVMEENFDFFTIYDTGTNEVFANITGYSVPAPLVIDTQRGTSAIRLVSGSNGGASVPVDKGPRRFELYAASSTTRMTGGFESIFKEITI